MHGPLAERPPPGPIPGTALAHVDSWLFDMDNTLYPASVNLFAQIDRRMEAYVGELLGLDRAAARAVQKRYFHEHGTTLRGLMLSHGVDPHDFLGFVHDIDVSVLAPDPGLRAALKALPGRRFVFTNGDLPYAERVLAALGILDCFEAIHGIEAMDFHPKPDDRAYDGVLARFGLDPQRTLFAEDMAHNLMPAKARGMTTLWVNNGSERGAHGHSPAFIDHETHDLGHFLGTLTR
jgi:putative hydrolase of the HAD superfamily